MSDYDDIAACERELESVRPDAFRIARWLPASHRNQWSHKCRTDARALRVTGEAMRGRAGRRLVARADVLSDVADALDWAIRVHGDGMDSVLERLSRLGWTEAFYDAESYDPPKRKKSAPKGV